MEQEKTSDKINYSQLATAFLFLQAAGGLCSGRRNGMSPAKTVEAEPASEIAQDEMMPAYAGYEDSRKESII